MLGGEFPIHEARGPDKTFGDQQLNFDQVAKYATMGGLRHSVEHLLTRIGFNKSYMPKADARRLIEDHFLARNLKALQSDMLGVKSHVEGQRQFFGFLPSESRKALNTYKRVAKVLSKSTDPRLETIKEAAKQLYLEVGWYKAISEIGLVPSDLRPISPKSVPVDIDSPVVPKSRWPVAQLYPGISRQTALGLPLPRSVRTQETRDQLLDREMRIESNPETVERKLAANKGYAEDQELEIGLMSGTKESIRAEEASIGIYEARIEEIREDESITDDERQRLIDSENAKIESTCETLERLEEDVEEIQSLVEDTGIVLRDPDDTFQGQFFVGNGRPGDFSTHLDGAVGDAINMGVRNGQEDSHIVAEFPFGGQRMRLTGVFDGHNGNMASGFVTEHLQACLTYRLEQFSAQFPESRDLAIYNALKIALVDVGHLLFQNDPEDRSGTTATLQLQIGDHLWVANIGDSRTMLLHEDGRTVQLSEDQDPESERLRAAIETRGGRVKHGKVDGVGVARAIGDPDISGLSARCKIVRVEKPPTGYTIHVCDGITDVMTTAEIGAFVRARIDKGDSLAAAAKALVEEAFGRGSEDNLSVQIVDLSKPVPQVA